MGICASCGAENPEQARFCMACAAPLAETEAPERFRKTVTILFSDVVGSTALGERLDPETLSHVLSDYFEAVKPVVERHGGTLAKFIGDAVMAVFGLVELHEDDGLRAVRAALEMRGTLAELNPELERRYGVALATRTGINTGPVAGQGLVPDRNFVAGDTANTAARLQTAAGENEILLGQQTYAVVRDAVDAELLAPLAAKGKADPLTVYRLTSVLPEAERVARRLETPLVGRANEGAELEWAFRRCVEERACRLVTLVGPPGVGKSRLVQELARRVEAEATVLEGRCLPYGEGITYWPLAQMVRQAAAIEEDDSGEQALAKLRGIAPSEAIAERVAGLIGLREAGGSAAEGPWAVRRLLETLARRRPLVWVCDDLHWAEEALLDLIQHVVVRAEDAPLLLLCVARPELLESRRDWPEPLELRPLSGAEADTLLATLAGTGQMPRRARDRLVQAAEGNPLFLEQLVAMLVDEGVLIGGDGDLADVPIPPTIQALLAARLEKLESHERALLCRAAVVGQLFYRGAIQELAPVSLRPQVDSILLALVRKELVAPARSDLGSEDAFRFRHLLIRDAAYEALTKEDRAELHERFADWLERSLGERAEEVEEILGYHLEQAHRSRAELGPVDEHGRLLADRAADRLASAGRRAFGRGDAVAAAALLARAAALVPAGHPRLPELLVEYSWPLLRQGRFQEADAVLADAAATAADVGIRTLAELRRRWIELQVDPDCDVAGAEAEARQAAVLFEERGDDRSAAYAWYVLSYVEWVRCRAESRSRASERMLAAAERAGDLPSIETARGGLVDALLHGPTPTSTAVARFEELLAEAHDRPYPQASITISLATARAFRAEFEAARELAHEAIARFDQLGLTVLSHCSRAEDLGWLVEAASGDWEAAERELRAGYEALEAVGEGLYLPTHAGYLAHCLHAQGRDEEAEDFARIAAEGNPDDIWTQALWRTARAKLLVRGHAAEAVELAREAAALVRETDFLALQASVLLDVAAVLQAAGRLDEAREAAQEGLAVSERKEYLVGVARARALLAELDAAPAAR